LLLLLINWPVSASSGQESELSSFDAQLQEAVKPLLSLPAEQRLQLTKVLRLYATELNDLRTELTDSTKRYRLEISGLKIDLTLTSEQLTELSRLLNEERTAKAAEIQAVKDEAFQAQLITVGVAVAVASAAYFFGRWR